jgi:secondary thiamine-phosphate synthase enzyme
MVFQEKIDLQTNSRSHWVDISSPVDVLVKRSGIQAGVCTIVSVHTTAGITINENADPDVQKDFFKKLNHSFPQDDAFLHAEGNSDSHIKASLIGFSVQVPVISGKLLLGTWQSVYFCEFDGPRKRHVHVTIIGE